MTKSTMIGVDLAKNGFQLHGASLTGKVLFRKKLSRQKIADFRASLSPAIVVMEACGGAHYWAREMRFVEPKTAEQQAGAVLFRARERLVHQRTELIKCPAGNFL